MSINRQLWWHTIADAEPVPAFRFVQTDMGNRGAQCNGLEKAPMTISESVEGIVNQVCQHSPLALPSYLTSVTGRWLIVDLLIFPIGGKSLQRNNLRQIHKT